VDKLNFEKKKPLFELINIPFLLIHTNAVAVAAASEQQLQL
jgi:hypothetical protein